MRTPVSRSLARSLSLALDACHLGLALWSERGGAAGSTRPPAVAQTFVGGALIGGGLTDFVVNSTAGTDDSACTAEAGGCTLREAISAANSTAGTTPISFDPLLTAGGSHPHDNMQPYADAELPPRAARRLPRAPVKGRAISLI